MLESESSTDGAKLGLVEALGLDEPDRPADGQRRPQRGVHLSQRRIGRHAERLEDLREERAARCRDRDVEDLGIGEPVPLELGDVAGRDPEASRATARAKRIIAGSAAVSEPASRRAPSP